MGWVCNALADDTKSVFCEITSKFSANDIKRTLTEFGGENCSPFEFFVDYLRDYYNVSLETCKEICEMIKQFYGKELPYFYAYEKK